MEAEIRAEPLLQVTGLTKHFLGVVALDNVDVTIYKGELMSLIGPNGSGKTTFFNCVTSFLTPDGGKVYFKGEDITQLRADLVALRGIRRTFQNVRIFPEMTVQDNLIAAIQQQQEENLLARLLRTRRIREFDAQASRRALELMEMTGLARFRHQSAKSLAFGQRKLLEFAAALMPDPDLVLLDEPAAGVSTAMIDQMKTYILALNAQGKTFLVVEHNMGVVMDISQRIIVLDYGRKIAEGTPREIQQNSKVLEAYFGS